MDSERWEQVERLYHAALELAPGERAALLETANPEVRSEVESLIGYAGRAEGMLEVRPTIEQPEPTGPVFPAGEVLDRRFRIVRLIGVGGMGEVYEASDLVLGEAIALKTIRPDVAGKEILRARLVEEVRAAKQIVHPGICRIYDLHLHGAGDLLFLTMELLRGETLAARLARSGAMRLEDAAMVAEQLAEALTAAHGVQVIHRDLKPENILLEPAERGAVRVVITDFGLARSAERSGGLQRLTRTGEIVGTLAYMAPEQLLCQPLTPAADIYALGVVLFEMVTGTRPFSGESRLAAAAKRVTLPPPSPRIIAPNLPVAWERAILRCLERDAGNRFGSAAEVWRAIAG